MDSDEFAAAVQASLRELKKMSPKLESSSEEVSEAFVEPTEEAFVEATASCASLTTVFGVLVPGGGSRSGGRRLL